MQIGGFRIQVIGVSASRARPAPVKPARNGCSADSIVTSYLSWLMLDPEPKFVVPRELELAVADGSYQVATPEISRSLVEDHLLVEP